MVPHFLDEGRLWVKQKGASGTRRSREMGWVGVMIIKTHFRRAIRDTAKYLQHLPSTELQNSGARWHCNSPLYPPRNHVATDGLTNTAQQEREGGEQKINDSLAMNYSSVSNKKEKKRKRKKNKRMNEIPRFSTSQARRSE